MQPVDGLRVHEDKLDRCHVQVALHYAARGDINLHDNMKVCEAVKLGASEQLVVHVEVLLSQISILFGASQMQSGQAFSIRDLGFQRAVKSLDLVRRLSANDPLFLLHQGLLSAQGILLSVLVRHAQQMGAISLHVVGEWKLSAFLLDQHRELGLWDTDVHVEPITCSPAATMRHELVHPSQLLLWQILLGVLSEHPHCGQSAMHQLNLGVPGEVLQEAGRRGQDFHALVELEDGVVAQGDAEAGFAQGAVPGEQKATCTASERGHQSAHGEVHTALQGGRPHGHGGAVSVRCAVIKIMCRTTS